MFALRRADRIAGFIRSQHYEHIKNAAKQIQPKRNAGHKFIYRGQYTPPRSSVMVADTIMFLTWTWVFYHIFAQSHHLVVHIPLPDPAAWSDKELGIPPEDSDE